MDTETSIEEQDRNLYNSIARQYIRKDIVGSSSVARKYKLFSALNGILHNDVRLGTLVEIGCGAGATAGYLAGYYDKYIGIDQSEELIRHAGTLNRQYRNVTFVAANIKASGLPPRCADVIFANGALHHMTELDIVMESLQAIAKPGTHLIVIEPQGSNAIIQFMRKIRAVLDKTYSGEQIFFAPEYLVELFARHGVTDITLDFQGFLSTPFAEVIVNPQFLSQPLAKGAVAADRLLKKHLPPALKRMSFNTIVAGTFQ